MYDALQVSGSCRTAVIFAVAAGWLASAADIMPVAQQNALVQKYCSVCHTDAARNGGLSLEHFDAAEASPSLKAMLLSKLSGGVSLDMVRKAGSDPNATALVDGKMKSGAIGAAGIAQPDKATIDAWIHAFAVDSKGATEWTVRRSKEEARKARRVTASILQEAPLTPDAGEAQVYHLILSCQPATQEGSIQLAWSPAARTGTLAISVDGKAAARYSVGGSEKMGNGSGLELHGAAAWMLAETKPGAPGARLPFPAQSLTVSDLFPGQTLTFPFATLPKDARHEFEACFSNTPGSDRVAARAAGERVRVQSPASTLQ